MRKEILQKVPTKGFLRKSTNLKFGVIITTMDTNTEISNRRFTDGDDILIRISSHFTYMEQKFDGIDLRREFDSINRRFDAIDAQFGRVSERFEGVDQRLDSIDKRLDKLEKRSDTREQRFTSRTSE